MTQALSTPDRVRQTVPGSPSIRLPAGKAGSAPGPPATALMGTGTVVVILGEASVLAVKENHNRTERQIVQMKPRRITITPADDQYFPTFPLPCVHGGGARGEGLERTAEMWAAFFTHTKTGRLHAKRMATAGPWRYLSPWSLLCIIAQMQVESCRNVVVFTGGGKFSVAPDVLHRGARLVRPLPGCMPKRFVPPYSQQRNIAPPSKRGAQAVRPYETERYLPRP